MKLSNRDLRKSPLRGWNMTAMIDVVFLLLVFFLTTSSFVMPQKDLEAAIAAREQVGGAADADLEPARVRISRDGAQTIFRMGAVTTTDSQKISGMLQRFSHKAPGLFVEVEAGVPFNDVATLLAIGREAGFRPVTWLPATSGTR